MHRNSDSINVWCKTELLHSTCTVMWVGVYSISLTSVACCLKLVRETAVGYFNI